MSSITIDTVLTQAAEDSPRVYIQDGFLWDRHDAYLFDIDGTLLRSRDRIHYESFFESVRTVMGRELVLDGVILSGNTDPGIFHDAFRLAELDPEHWQPMLEDVLAHMRASVAAQRDQMSLVKMPGIDEILAYLRSKGAALGIGTGNLESIGWLKLEVLGVRHWFTFGGFADSFPIRSDMIADAAKQARNLRGADATICVIGDTPADIRAARANHLPTIAVATGHFSFEELMEHRPEACVSTLAALTANTAL